MGIVFSCLASTFLLIGEVCSTVFLAIGEVGAMLLRGMFSLIVGLCDVLAACACCCRVPFSDRPDRGGYTYNTMALRIDAPAERRLTDKSKFSSKSFASHKQLFTVPAIKRGSKAKDAAAKADSAAVAQQADTSVATTAVEGVSEPLTESAAIVDKAAQAEARSVWFSGWFGSSKSATAA